MGQTRGRVLASVDEDSVGDVFRVLGDCVGDEVCCFFFSDPCDVGVVVEGWCFEEFVDPVLVEFCVVCPGLLVGVCSCWGGVEDVSGDVVGEAFFSEYDGEVFRWGCVLYVGVEVCLVVGVCEDFPVGGVVACCVEVGGCKCFSVWFCLSGWGGFCGECLGCEECGEHEGGYCCF